MNAALKKTGLAGVSHLTNIMAAINAKKAHKILLKVNGVFNLKCFDEQNDFGQKNNAADNKAGNSR